MAAYIRTLARIASRVSTPSTVTFARQGMTAFLLCWTNQDSTTKKVATKYTEEGEASGQGQIPATTSRCAGIVQGIRNQRGRKVSGT